MSLRPKQYRVEERAKLRFDKFDRKGWVNIGEMEQLFVAPDPTNQTYYFASVAIVSWFGNFAKVWRQQFGNIIQRIHDPLSESLQEALLRNDYTKLRHGVVHDAGDFIEAAAGVLHSYDANARKIRQALQISEDQRTQSLYAIGLVVLRTLELAGFICRNFTSDQLNTASSSSKSFMHWKLQLINVISLQLL